MSAERVVEYSALAAKLDALLYQDGETDPATPILEVPRITGIAYQDLGPFRCGVAIIRRTGLFGRKAVVVGLFEGQPSTQEGLREVPFEDYLVVDETSLRSAYVPSLKEKAIGEVRMDGIKVPVRKVLLKLAGI